MAEEFVQEAVGSAVDELGEEPVGAGIAGAVLRPHGGEAAEVVFYYRAGAGRPGGECQRGSNHRICPRLLIVGAS
jgi:hypothetical protein